MVADARDRLAEAKERLAEAQAAFQSLAGPQIS
jgi:hypothetical protein